MLSMVFTVTYHTCKLGVINTRLPFTSVIMFHTSQLTYDLA